MGKAEVRAKAQAEGDVCFVCAQPITEEEYDEEDEGDRLVLVLVRGNVREVHCSASCLAETLRQRRVARAATRRRWFLTLCALLSLPLAATILWHRYRAPGPEWISSAAPAPEPDAPPSEPIYFGPAWPPTDEEWITAFRKARWMYPLPGPNRRACAVDGRICAPEVPAGVRRPVCRAEGRCGVDLGGDLWGEHVYAAHDGVVDRVNSGAGDTRGGQYVRIAHFGGMVFTQYFHLAAIPRGIIRGARVRAGQIIGLLGDTGAAAARSHLHFTLSVLPSKEFAEVYWDPEALMAEWPLRLPPRGTVAGLVPPERQGPMPRPAAATLRKGRR